MTFYKAHNADIDRVLGSYWMKGFKEARKITVGLCYPQSNSTQKQSPIANNTT